MAEICETQDTLVSNSSADKGMPGMAQALPNVCFALPLRLKIKIL